MKKGKEWTPFSIAVLVTGLVLFAEGLIYLMNYYFPQISIFWLYFAFALVLFIVALFTKSNKTHEA